MAILSRLCFIFCTGIVFYIPANANALIKQNNVVLQCPVPETFNQASTQQLSGGLERFHGSEIPGSNYVFVSDNHESNYLINHPEPKLAKVYIFSNGVACQYNHGTAELYVIDQAQPEPQYARHCRVGGGDWVKKEGYSTCNANSGTCSFEC